MKKEKKIYEFNFYYLKTNKFKPMIEHIIVSKGKMQELLKDNDGWFIVKKYVKKNSNIHAIKKETKRDYPKIKFVKAVDYFALFYVEKDILIENNVLI